MTKKSIRRSQKLFIILLLFQLTIYHNSSYAQIGKTNWGSLKYKQTYLRTGPSKENKVLWTYKKKGLPLRIMRKRGDWYYVEMADKEKGWVNSSQVSTKRTIIVISEDLMPLRENFSTNSRIIAKVEKNAIGDLLKCERIICEIDFYEVIGFAKKEFLWGVD
ncbi:MAG TPA: hypothetical protein EYN33_02680 [Gammaproteobacteria bacterium]|jgi:SH3-like domain-containing protein|nr:hypothetical protein [Gammaproteobacteria bacterium]